jgi:hypothetical protein
MSNDKHAKDNPRVYLVELLRPCVFIATYYIKLSLLEPRPHPASPQYPWSSRKYSSSHVCSIVLKNIHTMRQCPSF